MNEKALYDLTYGLFLVSSKAEGKENGCIVNTVIQAASNPTRLAVSCINGNLTPELIKKSGYFTVTVIDKTAKFDLFQTFGMTHGKDIDKFAGYDVKHDANGMPYIENNACSIFALKVVSFKDLGSHTLIIGEVVGAEKLSDNKPLTYAEYHSDVKPQVAVNKEKKIVGWRCTICGFVYQGETLPSDYICPLCKHPASDFEPIYE